jgi:hypothetical protein
MSKTRAQQTWDHVNKSKAAVRTSEEVPRDLTVKKYRRPFNSFIGHGESTETLYKLEDQRDDAFRAAAVQLGAVLGLTDFWHEMLPEAIFSMLDHWDRAAVHVACVAYLERHGYAVTEVSK